MADISRRDFVKTASTVAGAAAVSQWISPEAQGETTSEGMIYRTLGRTGERVSAIGLGGYHIGKPSIPEPDSIRLIQKAIDSGITFLDNCWDYNDGQSEFRMGKALAGGYRNKIFLMTKIDGRTKAATAQQIDESLKRLQTDHVDLMQFHEVIRLEDLDRIFAEGGGMEAMLEAKKMGKVRFVGFTGHKDPYVHLRMLEVARKHGFHFDAVQMPLNPFDGSFFSFQQQVVPEAQRRGMAVLGMKPLSGAGDPGKKGVLTPEEARRYAMSVPGVTVTFVPRVPTIPIRLFALAW